MVAHFPFNGNVDDISTSGIFALNNNCIFGADRLGNPNMATEYNNTDSYVSFNDNIVKDSLPISISVWIKVNSFSTPNPIFVSDNQFENYSGYMIITTVNTGKLSLNISAGLGGYTSANRRSFTSDTSLSTGVWHHVVAIIRAYNDMSIYLDCQELKGTYSGGMFHVSAMEMKSDQNSKSDS